MSRYPADEKKKKRVPSLIRQMTNVSSTAEHGGLLYDQVSAFPIGQKIYMLAEGGGGYL